MGVNPNALMHVINGMYCVQYDRFCFLFHVLRFGFLGPRIMYVLNFIHLRFFSV